MNITRKQNSRNKNYSNDSSGGKVSTFVFDLQTLDLYCAFVLSQNAAIRTSNFSTMRKIFDKLDRNAYKNEPDKLVRFDFIKKALSARLDYKLKDRYLINQCVNGGPLDKQLLDISDYKELSTEVIEWILKSLSDVSQFLVFQPKDVQDLMAQLNDLIDPEKSGKSEMIADLKVSLTNLMGQLRRAEMDTGSESDFSLESGVFEDRITDIYNQVTNPSRKLKTGMQGLNNMIGGGFESQRVYLFLGLAGGGKSFTLLDLMVQIKKYNANYICHDQTKRPCIILLTQENSVKETVERLYTLLTGRSMSAQSLEETIASIRDHGMCMTDDNPINILVRYRANLSVDTTYLRTMCEEINEQGYEPMLMVQDHIKRIEPEYNQRDTRLNLGEVVNEFKSFANEYDIPVLTDSHLNRDAAKIIEEATRKNKNDATKLLGTGNVSESMLMIDNCDVGIIINKEPGDGTFTNGGMGFKQIKARIKSKLDYFVQPYEAGNPIKLVEDLYSQIPSYKTEIGSNLNFNNLSQSRMTNNNQNNSNQDQIYDLDSQTYGGSGYYEDPNRLMNHMNGSNGGGVFKYSSAASEPIYDLQSIDQQVKVHIPITEENMKSNVLVPAIYFEDEVGRKYYTDRNDIIVYL